MAWYLRKSVNVGPIRFNISKSGIGTSVGVKGFRVGIKPNGRSYVHAGRHGIYYHEEFSPNNQQQQYLPESSHTTISPDTTVFKTVSSNELSSDSRVKLVDQLNNSYNAFRFDFLMGITSLVAAIISYNINQSLMYGVILIGIILTIIVARWETNRRTINLYYEFENENHSIFEQIILAFNHLANCNRIWSLLTSRSLYDAHQSKLNAGASKLVDRLTASAGNGNPPWVKANITIPTIKTGNRSLYFMPDGILVYDNHGVGFVDYSDLKIIFNTTRFIEEIPPQDARIVDRTWKYPNKNGGPDKRFNNNLQIPVCLYGELRIEARNQLLLYIMTSKANAPENFSNLISNLSSISI